MIYFRRSSITKKVGAAFDGYSDCPAVANVDPPRGRKSFRYLIALGVVVIGVISFTSLAAQAQSGGQTFAGCSTDGTALGRDPFTGLVTPAPQFNNLCKGAGNAFIPRDTSWYWKKYDLWYMIGGLAYGYNQPPPPPPGQLGGPVNFKMYGTDGADGAFAVGDVLSTHNSGYKVSDTAGAIAPGSLAPGFHDFTAGGGFDATVDGSRFFGFSGNQKLILGLNLDYQRSQTDYGTSALTLGVTSAAAVGRDIYTVAGSATYTSGLFYLNGIAAFDWSRANITNNVDSGTGNTDGHGYAFNGTVGQAFPLFNTTGVNPAIPTKATRPGSSLGRSNTPTPILAPMRSLSPSSQPVVMPGCPTSA